ncbi:MAG: glycosyltransferase [Candidatus Cloacimonetes bacterium]|nr:glycosyltransferase [Candidatus Cloacimonadota bacterium]
MKLSVIIPTRNRAMVLEKALQSIVNQTISQNHFEVIVVDNGSTDDTKSIVDSFVKKIKNLVYIYDENSGLHIGRHRGLLVAHADVLVYGDDDIEATPTWLEGVIESFEDESVALVGGKNIPNFESTPPNWILDMWEKGGEQKVLGYLSILDFGDEIQEINPNYVFGCNFSIRKAVLLEAGGFHPDGMPQEIIKYRGDGESYVSKYIINKSYKTIYNPKASVYHLCSTDRMTKKYFAQRSFNQGVSDSYTDIRESKHRNFFKTKVRIIIKKYLLRRDTMLEEEFIRGYEYHQNEAKKDSHLMEWIKRESYINNGSIK